MTTATITRKARAAAAADASGWCAIYLRISDDKEGTELGVTRQREDCAALAAAEGLRVYRVYCDNDRGASTRSRKPRPEYDAMIADARAGRFAVIVAATSSRLTRRPMEHEGQIILAEQFGITYAYVKSPSFDLATADGRMIARNLSNYDTAESERIAERVTRARRQQAEQGRYGGGRRPYGFDADGVTVRLDEAEIIARAAEAVLAGISPRMIARALNDGAVPTVTGVPWSAEALVDILCRPRNAGHMVYRGEVIGAAPWDALVSHDVWMAVVSRLTDPSRSTGPGRPPRWLGTGIYRCVCGSTVEVQGGTTNAPAYMCKARRDGLADLSVTHIRRNADRVDELVRLAVIARVSGAEAAALFDAPEATEGVDVAELRAERARKEASRGEVEAMIVSGELAPKSGANILKGIDARLAEIDDTLDRLVSRSPAAALVDAADPAAVFDAMTLGERRAIVRELVTVTILPATGPRFRPESVRIEYRTG